MTVVEAENYNPDLAAIYALDAIYDPESAANSTATDSLVRVTIANPVLAEKNYDADPLYDANGLLVVNSDGTAVEGSRTNPYTKYESGTITKITFKGTEGEYDLIELKDEGGSTRLVLSLDGASWGDVYLEALDRVNTLRKELARAINTRENNDRRFENNVTSGMRKSIFNYTVDDVATTTASNIGALANNRTDPTMRKAWMGLKERPVQLDDGWQMIQIEADISEFLGDNSDDSEKTNKTQILDILERVLGISDEEGQRMILNFQFKRNPLAS